MADAATQFKITYHERSAAGRLAMQLAAYLDRHPDAQRGLTTMCVGLGMGAAVLWERA